MSAPAKLMTEAGEWQWPLDLDQYDRTPSLSMSERTDLHAIVVRSTRGVGHYPSHHLRGLGRLKQPLDDVSALMGAPASSRIRLWRRIFHEMDHRGTTFWAWTDVEWQSVLTTPPMVASLSSARPYVVGAAYLLGGFTHLHRIGVFAATQLAHAVFGPERVHAAAARIQETLTSWGYAPAYLGRQQPTLVAIMLLLNRSPVLEDLTLERIQALLQEELPPAWKRALTNVRRVLAHFGMIDLPPAYPLRTRKPSRQPNMFQDVPTGWLEVCTRWRTTSTLAPGTRKGMYEMLLKVGRWLHDTHPQVTLPEQWTRELAAEHVAAVNGWAVGDYSVGNIVRSNIGKPLAPGSIDRHLAALRGFFRDMQEWQWIPRRFDPGRAFRTPRSVKAKMAPDPRVIADDIWAKLLWAGLNLTADDISKSGRADRRTKRPTIYPVELVRALVLVWLFAGLRSDEIARLRVGCIRRSIHQRPPGDDSTTSRPTCWLAVPVNKTNHAYTKPVDTVVGEAIEAWEAVRPNQPNLLDPKTGELVQYLFAYRGYAFGRYTLNLTIIPMLCRKAGVPEHDARGPITSHRARSTIASQLFNAKEPMSLFELKEWLGHRSLNSTQYYAKLTPTRMATSYQEAGYFERNLRTIEVLIDQDAVLNGDATRGLPWKYYDLGHGYCTYDFFEHCEHRMACAQCGYYRPKNAFLFLLEEKKAHLLYMKQEIPLTDLELAVVEGDLAATEQLMNQLRDTPTPAGLTPRALRDVDDTIEA